MLMWFLCLLFVLILFGLLAYWLLVVTEGVFLGRRVVVWLYDLTAHKYDDIKQFGTETEQFFVVRPLLQSLTNQPAPRILDVATGTGRLPYHVLNDPLFHGRVYGLDASEKMLDWAAEKIRPFGDRAPLIQGVADKLPFPADYFQAVTSLEALEFFPDDVAALHEIVRVLQPGGVLLVTRRRGWEAKAFVGRYRDPQTFEALLQNLGLVAIDTRLWQVEYDLIFAQKPKSI